MAMKDQHYIDGKWIECKRSIARGQPGNEGKKGKGKHNPNHHPVDPYAYMAPPAYGQPAYGAPPAYGQPPAYGAPPPAYGQPAYLMNYFRILKFTLPAA